ncbi:hypothetical protein LUZ60_010194 [Juncus effusus]|nr:hypothetical protein LUZ60_010194 [Juncus effusus]
MPTEDFHVGSIDPKRARFPCCIVWTPLPFITWLIPFVGHLGICREDGVILDFAGPYFISVDNFAFGAVTRYVQISRDECYKLIDPEGELTWDETLRKGMQEYQNRTYNLFTCNCHSFVANNLNRLFYAGHEKWNVVTLAALVFLRGKFVSKSAVFKSFLPFFLVLGLGFFWGGLKFLIGLVGFMFVLTGWFVFGTYCFKNVIQL